jgi:ankyrin repeat protein
MTEAVLIKRRAAQPKGALAAGLREAQLARRPAQDSAAVVISALGELSSDEETDPLCAACESGRLNAVRRVLSTGADPCAVGSQGMTPLFIASQVGNAHIVSALLEARADPSQPCFGGATPLYAAASRDHVEAASLLLSAGAPVDAIANAYYTPLLAAVCHGAGDMARALLAAGAAADAWSDKWGTLLHAAAKAGRCEMLRLLIAHGADLKAVHDGRTPQQLAHERGQAEAAALLRKAAERRGRLAVCAASKSAPARATQAVLPAEGWPIGGAGSASGGAAVAGVRHGSLCVDAKGTSVTGGDGPDKGVGLDLGGDGPATGLASDHKASKRARQKARRRAEASLGAVDHVLPSWGCASGGGGGSLVQPGHASPQAAGYGLTVGRQEAGVAERRADALLAERALAEISVDAARRVARSAALEAAGAAAKQEAERRKLKALAGGAARREATSQALLLHSQAVAIRLRPLGASSVDARVHVCRDGAPGGGGRVEGLMRDSDRYGGDVS